MNIFPLEFSSSAAWLITHEEKGSNELLIILLLKQVGELHCKQQIVQIWQSYQMLASFCSHSLDPTCFFIYPWKKKGAVGTDTTFRSASPPRRCNHFQKKIKVKMKGKSFHLE